MIVRFDTPEEAKERFEALRKKYKPAVSEKKLLIIEIKNDEDDVSIWFQLGHYSRVNYLNPAAIEVWVVAERIENLLTAMKIVDLMSEV